MAKYITTWIVTALLVLVAEIMVGVLCRHHALGILIDNRNKYSLSRLQIVLWTTVLVSALFAILFELRHTSIYVPPEVWALLGISAGTAAGAIMIKDIKAHKEPTPQAAAKQIAAGPGPGMDATPPIGVLATASKPRFSDLFLGEELADEKYVDISKVQMFFFTLVAIIGYVFALASWNVIPPDGELEKVFPDAATLKASYAAFLPPLSAALVTIIGISHVGYLTVKASPKTPTT